MKIPMEERRILIKNHAGAYRRAGRKEKTIILNHFVKITGYNRVHAARVLRNHQTRLHLGKGRVAQVDAAGWFKRGRGREYGSELIEPLTKIWENLDYLCGKRLKHGLPGALESLERHGEIELDEEARGKLLKMSASTMDRLLRKERAKYVLKGRSGTKPGTLLKCQIPIRTFSEWDEERPGFVEIDLVGHEGGSSSGDFTQTLAVTDICTGWSEQAGVLNKAQTWVFEALLEIRSRLPLPLLGIDSDNGSEFINHHLFKYCEEEELTFTRSRPHRKNDTCFVEQKNYSIVRRAAGYSRYEGTKAVESLNRLYALVRLRTNFFLPSMKLVEKQRIGSRVHKKYDTPKTPYQRVLESPEIEEKIKETLREQYRKLNLGELKRRIGKAQQDLERLAGRPRRFRGTQENDSLGIHQQKEGRPSPPEPSIASVGERRMAPAEKG